MSVYSSECCSDQASDVCRNGTVLPNSSRTDWTSAETGFQSAMVFSNGGKLLVGTNVLATNVSGKITMKLALLTTSGVRTISPTVAITQLNAYANSSSRRNPRAASGPEEWIRQPTTRPVTTMTTIEIALSPTSAAVRPTSTADRLIGSERNRSMSPFWMSSAMLAPVMVDPKITVWARMPGSRHSTYAIPGIGTALPKT